MGCLKWVTGNLGNNNGSTHILIQNLMLESTFSTTSFFWFFVCCNWFIQDSRSKFTGSSDHVPVFMFLQLQPSPTECFLWQWFSWTKNFLCSLNFKACLTVCLWLMFMAYNVTKKDISIMKLLVVPLLTPVRVHYWRLLWASYLMS
jgi:hypothetical protein